MADTLAAYVVSLFSAQPSTGGLYYKDQSRTSVYWMSGVGTTTSNPKFGTQCLSFSSGKLTPTGNVATAARISATSDFCVEAWIYPTTVTGTQAVYSIGDNTNTSAPYFTFCLSGSALALNYSASTAATTMLTLSGGTVATNTWQHVAVERVGTALTLYLGGTAVANATLAAGFTFGFSGQTTNAIWGSVRNAAYNADPSGTYTNPFTGNMDELRATSGAYRYNGAFTPPATRFEHQLVTYSADTNEFHSSSVLVANFADHLTGATFFSTDLGNCATTVLGGVNVQAQSPVTGTANALYFDGSSDYVRFYNNQTSYSSEANIGASTDFWGECWAMQSGVNSNTDPICIGSTGTSTNVSFNQTTIGMNIRYGATLASVAVHTSISLWYHYLVSRVGSSLLFFVDGVQVGSATYTGAPGENFTIGAASSTTSTFPGWITAVRLGLSSVPTEYRQTKFNPPTKTPKPLSAYDTYRNNVLVAIPNYAGRGGSGTFDYTGRTLVYPNGAFTPAAHYSETYPILNGSGIQSSAGNYCVQTNADADLTLTNSDDFTVECSFTGRSTGANTYVFTFGDTASGNWFGIYFGTTSNEIHFVNNGTDLYSSGASGYGNNNGSIAITRASGITKLWVQYGNNNFSTLWTSTADQLVTPSGAFKITVGGAQSGASAVLAGREFTNFRFTKGVARTISGIPKPIARYGPNSLSGHVYDASNNPVARKVRAYARASGVLVGETTSSAADGTWVIPAYADYEHTVIAYDTTGANAQVFDKVIPATYP